MAGRGGPAWAAAGGSAAGCVAWGELLVPVVIWRRRTAAAGAAGTTPRCYGRRTDAEPQIRTRLLGCGSSRLLCRLESWWFSQSLETRVQILSR